MGRILFLCRVRVLDLTILTQLKSYVERGINPSHSAVLTAAAKPSVPVSSAVTELNPIAPPPISIAGERPVLLTSVHHNQFVSIVHRHFNGSTADLHPILLTSEEWSSIQRGLEDALTDPCLSVSPVLSRSLFLIALIQSLMLFVSLHDSCC